MKAPVLARFFMFLLTAMAAFAVNREELWQQAKEAARQGLPKTAIERLDPIIASAVVDQAYGEAIHALGRKLTLEASIQGSKPQEKIVRLESELKKAPAPMQPMMEALLGHWYWQYFQQNRWRYLHRTPGAATDEADLETWDLRRIFSEIDRHFTLALRDEATLRATPIALFDDLLRPGTVPDAYRPTLYDFVAHQTLEFYQTGEHAGVEAEDAFQIDAAVSPIFQPVEAFLAWEPATTDVDSPRLKAIRLYQALMRFHQTDADRSAFLDLDLARLRFGANAAVGEGKAEQYRAALRRFIETSGTHEVAGRAYAALANQVHGEGDALQAHTIAKQGLDAFPKTIGGAQCYNLVQQIEMPSLQMSTEAVWNAPWPTIDVTYRNVRKVYFRAVALDFEKELEYSRWSYPAVEHKRALQRVKGPAALEWSAELPATSDFKNRTERLPAPSQLKPGYYALIASHDPSFGEENNQVTFTTVWVSDLALIVRQRLDGQAHSGFVMNATTGAPISGAMVTVLEPDNEGRYQRTATLRTDSNGLFTLDHDRGSVLFRAEYNGHSIATTQASYLNGSREVSTGETTVFFTDRALYRPGQSIQYKGLSLRYDQAAGTYAAIGGREVVVAFQDSQHKEIARATHRTNEFGSFSGVFTAPRDRLMGEMNLVVLEGASGSTTFSVEEYKRPKFLAELMVPAEAARLGEAVALRGKATAYTGAAIGGATVQWRVERAVQLPPWCWWWAAPADQAVAHGTVQTEPDGGFHIEFPAAPDRSVPEATEPVFVFTVHADVTDTTGETRSTSRVIRAGYTALRANVEAEDWQSADQPVRLTVTTESLDGDGQAARGTVRLFSLQQPERPLRAPLPLNRFRWQPTTTGISDPSHPDQWPLGERGAELPFQTDGTGKTVLEPKLKPGIYRVQVETVDRFGRKVTARRTVQVLDPKADRYEVKLPNLLVAPRWTVEPGETFVAYWGTGYDSGRAYVEVECQGKVLDRFWTPADRTQTPIRVAVTESMRGGFNLRVTYVRENRAYLNQRVVSVPWTNKQLQVRWERFRSKLQPGQTETWTAVVSGPVAKRAAVEMVATLYDASLDAYRPHAWPQGFSVLRAEQTRIHAQFHNTQMGFNYLWESWRHDSRFDAWVYRRFPYGILQDDWDWFEVETRPGANLPEGDDKVVLSPFEVSAGRDAGYTAHQTLAGARLKTTLADVGSAVRRAGAEVQAAPPIPETGSAATPNLSTVTARRNLSETAFFLPHLVSEKDGTIRIQFTAPEALTEWKFMGFAHTAEAGTGFLTGQAVTAKDLMVEPNPPRFLREGDEVEFTVKITNLSEQTMRGRARLTFQDAASLESVDTALSNQTPEQSFELPAKQSRSLAWKIAVPEGQGFLAFKAVAATADLSDGEEGVLPVLSRRVLVRESLPLPIRGRSSKTFEFSKLLGSAGSDTLQHQSLTVQMTSQPAWYAVMALPYLMEYPYECSEQIFNRYYANALAAHIASSNPKIRRTFDLWKATPALESPLDKNEDLKAVLLQETPWLREAADESRARKNVGLLFDANRLESESARTLQKLVERQLGAGLWSWFPGGRPNEYISLYIATGFGRLRALGVAADVSPAVRSFESLDRWMNAEYEELRKGENADLHVPDSVNALYLYGRSFFLTDRPVAPEHQAALDFFLRQARKHWVKVDSRQSQAHLALALKRFGDTKTAAAIVRSLKERSVSDEELGMYWRDLEFSAWWYHAPIETQALMIEAFAEVANDAEAVEACKVWLLKQKQTQDWRTTKATADAIYALLLRGQDLLASDARVEVSLGGQRIEPKNVEAGTGFYEETFSRAEIQPAMGRIEVRKTDDGVSWGSVHWQYLEDLSKITPHQGTPLKLRKALFTKVTTAKGQELRPVVGAIAVGDELVVRIELRVDRDLEYVHLKDQRGSGTEPVAVLSGYRYQDGLAYYESTRDTASHFFIDYLPKGTYVFEYSTRVQLKGLYQTGIAEIQCMYAPEFNSHSESVMIEVK